MDSKIAVLQARADEHRAEAAVLQTKADAHRAEAAKIEIQIEEINKQPLSFSKWAGPDGIQQHIINQTGCNVFAGVGICHRPRLQTAVLRSDDNNDNTCYYADNLDIVKPDYTLFGPNGDQDIHEKKYNEPLLNEEKTKHIYLYRVSKNKNKTTWTWYGKYTISGHHEKDHVGRDGSKRIIVLLELTKCAEVPFGLATFGPRSVHSQPPGVSPEKKETLVEKMARMKASIARKQKDTAEARDIDLVMSQAGVTRSRAAEALNKENGDIVNAIMTLGEKRQRIS